MTVVPTQPPVYCGLTQGGYGNATATFNGVNRVDMINTLITPTTPLTIGVSGTKALIFEYDPVTQNGPGACITSVMPGNGSPSAFHPSINGDYHVIFNGTSCNGLPSKVLNKQGTLNNNLLSQTITLGLNLRINCYCGSGLGDYTLNPLFCTHDVLPGPDGLRGTSDDILDPGPDQVLGTFDDPVTAYTIPQTVLTALLSQGQGDDVNALFILANRALAGQTTYGASFGDITDAINSINVGFDMCAAAITCPPPRVLPIADRTYQHGDQMTAITFSDPVYGNAVFNWSATENVGFGLAGTGNIGSFPASNMTGSTVVSTVSVTSTHHSVTGPATTFNVTVYPAPSPKDATQADIEGYDLAENHPNPFNPITTITFQVPEPSVVRLSVINALGQEIAVLVDREVPVGRHSVRWNAIDANGEVLPSGTYMYRMQANSTTSDKQYHQVRKMLLMK